MKILLIFAAVLLQCISSNAAPLHNVTAVEKSNILPDLSQDREFVKIVIEIAALQSKTAETNSDYSGLNNSFKSIAISIVTLKNKYPELNDQASAIPIINKAIDKLIEEGKVSNHGDDCLRELLHASVNCIKTSTTWAALRDCLRAAHAQFVACRERR